MSPRYLVNRSSQAESTRVQVGSEGHSVVFGGTSVVLVAGPCSVESLEQMMTVGKSLKSLGIQCLRGGAFKPRTSPYSFQGLGRQGLEILGEVRKALDLLVITEVMSIKELWEAEPFIDCFQVGSRNMQNFELLKALGRQEKPVILKRGFAATLEEFLMAAEYILTQGNSQVILCERGLRGFDPATRNVLDLTAVPLLKERTHLPVIVDPSHGTGKRNLVLPASRGAVAVGADGILVEAHPQPENSISDAEQAISLQDLNRMTQELQRISQAVGRHLALSNTSTTHHSETILALHKPYCSV